MSDRPAYAIVAGQGRSGTNWLLELFDRSPETFCRSEPYGAPESPLNEFASDRHVIRPHPESLVRAWDAAVAHTLSHQGNRDRPLRTRNKLHLHPWSRVLALDALTRRPRVRAALSTLLPALRGDEWPFPRWLGSRQRLGEQLGVLKLVASPGWTAFALCERPSVAVVHIVRHPGGFLNSWAKRYLASRDQDRVLAESRARLQTIASCHAGWAETFGEIGARDVIECELLYWRYANEELRRIGKDQPGYAFVVYEDLVNDPVAVMRSLYAHCGLEWSPRIEDSLRPRDDVSASIARAWRDSLSAAQVRAVEAALEATALEVDWARLRDAG